MRNRRPLAARMPPVPVRHRPGPTPPSCEAGFARMVWLLLAGLLVLLAGGAATAGAAAAGPPAAVEVGRLEDAALWLRPHSRVLPEPDGMGPADAPHLLQRPLPWQTVTDAEPVFYFGYDRRAWWIHAALRNDGPVPVRRVVEVAEPLVDELWIWVIDRASAQPIAQAHMGDRLPFDTRPYDYRHPTLLFDLAPGQTVDLLLRVRAVDGEHDPLPVRLWDPPAFASHALAETTIYGAYYGAILVLLLYNVLVYVGTRERSFGWYALFLSSFVLWNLTYRGFALQYLWPQAVTWNQVALVGFSAGIYALMAVFSWSLLDVPRRTPWLFRLQAALALAALGHAAWIVVDPQAAVFGTLDPVGLAMFLALIAAAARIAWQGERVAGIYLAAHGALFVGALVYYLTKFEVLVPGPLTRHALNLGSVAEFVLLAFALAYRINHLKGERDAAQRQLLAGLQRAADMLEQQVAARTAELADANARLTTLAVRDELTGLYNRRRFNEALAEELGRARRGGHPLGLLMLDLDRFKALNDRAGHRRGDETLAALGRLLRERLQRRTDRIYRIGGEEFAVLLPDGDEAALRSLAERLRAAVEEARWPHPDAALPWITVSIGATLSCPEDTPESAYQRVDEALYAAKDGGRNRCEWRAPPAAAPSTR